MYVTMDVTFFEIRSFFHKAHFQGERSCEDSDPMSFLELLDSEELDNGSSCGESSDSGLGSGYEEIGTSGGKNMIQISQDPRPTLEIGRSPLENTEQPQPSLKINILGAENIEKSQPSLEINILGIESEGEATNMQKKCSKH